MRRLSTHRRQRGFTLIEIMVTTAIFAILMVAALAVYDKSNRVFKNATEAADMQQSTRIGFDKLVSDVRMAGFDYQRGGTPTSSSQFAQPDEQIEYAGVNVLAFRANFNYNTAVSSCTSTSTTPCGNGLEPQLMPPRDPTSGLSAFPYVSTSNDEIIIYALRAADASKNTQTISFWADVATPRAAYPSSVQGGSGTETEVCVGCAAGTGIDTTGNNPPYTLYRITATEAMAGQMGTPVAENIRNLRFFYYTDNAGSQVLKNLDGTDIANTVDANGNQRSALVNINGSDVNTGAIGGAGKYMVAADGTAITTDPHFNDRSVRGIIASVRVDLTGMNAVPDPNYTNPNETNAAFKNYREYQLSALITPRNLRLSGFPEPSYSAPTPPTIVSICTGHCAAPVICWTAPTGGGQVLEYIIQWDTNPQGQFNNTYIVTDPTLTTVVVPDTFGLTPSQTYYYRMVARNDNGDSEPSNPYTVQPKNATKPLAPSSLVPTTATAPHSTTPANTDYAIGLTWAAPTQNDASAQTLTCIGAGCGTDGRTIPPQEQLRYRVWRSRTATFNVTDANVAKILDESMTQPAGSAGSTMHWSDSPGTSKIPPAPCVPYYYRIQTVDRCVANTTYNASGAVSQAESVYYPVAGQTVTQSGQAYDAGPGVYAVAPATASVDTSQSACPAPSSTYCKIVLNWSQVNADTAGNAIAVDKYRITRYRKKLTDLTYSIDTTFNGTGTYDVSGYSQANSGTASYTDTTALANDVDTTQWYYQYTVQANDCRLSPNVSPNAQFPTACASTPSIVQAGAANGSTAGGMTPSDAWVFNTGDTITVTAPNGKTFVSVKFDVLAYPSGTTVSSTTYGAGSSATFSWTDTSSSGQIYYVRMTVSYGTCSEVYIRYVQQFTPSACAFSNQTLSTPTETTSGSSAFVSQAISIPVSGNSRIRIKSQNMKVTFVDPDTKHSDITMLSIQYGSGTFSTTDTFATAKTPGTYTVTIPSNMPDIDSGSSFSVTFRYKYAKKDVSIAGSPTTKVCISYNVLAFDSTTQTYKIDANDPSVKNCNVVGQAASTANPTSCD